MPRAKPAAKKAVSRIPKEVRETIVERLQPEMRRYVESGATDGFELSFSGRYLVVGAKSGTSRGRSRPQPLCRLRYGGDPEVWGFEIYRYSNDAFDSDQDFPFSRGTVEECFAVACDFYLWEYEALAAGSSYDPTAAPRPPGALVGPDFVLPRLPAGERAPLPALPAELGSAAGGPLLADFSAFLAFVDGRRFKLGERTDGLGRAELAEVNGRMSAPIALHARIVQAKVPRVQVCFHVAEALGLLEVDRARHLAVGRPDAAAFAALPEAERWWAILEALWQRVSWKALHPQAYGATAEQQAGRGLLGATFAQSARPLETTVLTRQAEVLECFLLPAWSDAGLVELAFEPRGLNSYPKRPGPALHRVEVTPLGRWAFGQLSDQSPGLGESPDEDGSSQAQFEEEQFDGERFEDERFEDDGELDPAQSMEEAGQGLLRLIWLVEMAGNQMRESRER